MFKCPYCDFGGRRSDVHNHLAESHPDALGSRVDEFTGHTFYIVTCPVCGASYEQVTKKARRDPNFVSEYEYEIRLVVFDLLLYHLQGEHEAGTSQSEGSMATVRGCNIPEDRYYWVEKHTWARPEEDGTVTIGITDVAQNLAKGIINATPKDIGRTVQKGKSAGTLESGKWVGPVASPVTGEIVAVNETMKAKPSLINSDPYGEGWFVRVRPTDWAGESALLVTGEAGLAAYQKFLEEQGIRCGG